MDRGALAALEALQWVGTPFVWQQSVKGRGCDCKMLAAGVARECNFAEARSVYATMADYSDQRRVPSALMRRGMEEMFDSVDFDREAARRGEVPADLLPGDHLLLSMATDPNHLAICARFPDAPVEGLRTAGQPTAVHAKIGSRSAVTETAIAVLLRKYKLVAVYRYPEISRER